ncbi:hypothetical protein H9623_18845 [Oerskovia sp. Sa1BUA8]|uniref:Uncharacterized protein n=2 Tax=Oerskovia TaxID=162491 RepID=A0A9D5Z1J6_9CELL|nr:MULTISPECIES: hypothetical protein [Oerskovia]MBD7981488.1 hypothetical protein [Oerskovia merdavium]MBE7702354.1 hypothetical protein [Oerskovia douganii]
MTGGPQETAGSRARLGLVLQSVGAATFVALLVWRAFLAPDAVGPWAVVLAVALVVAGVTGFGLVVRRRRLRLISTVRANRPGARIVVAHVPDELPGALVAAGRWVPGMRRASLFGAALAADGRGVELWTAGAARPLLALPWTQVAAITAGPPTPGPRGAQPAVRVHALDGVALPIVPAGGNGTRWRGARQREVDAVVADLRSVRDGAPLPSPPTDPA